MSTLLGKRPPSVVIFDRTKAGMSDVPVFSQNLKKKINTPLPEEKVVVNEDLSPQALQILQAIKAKEVQATESVLRADSSGGQTGEFAQSTEMPVSVTSVHTEAVPTQLEIAEDPRLQRIPTIVAEYIAPIIIEKAPTLLHTTHTRGLIDILILPDLRESLFTRFEPTWYAVKRLCIQSKRAAGRLQKNATVYVIKAQSWIKDSRRVQLPTLPKPSTLPSFTLPHFNFARFTSRALLAGSLVLMLMTVGPMVVLETQSWKQKILYAITNLPTKAEDTTQQAPEEVKPTPVPSPNPDPDKQFQIIIPRIGVNSRVIANVDAANEKEYDEALKKGVAHAAGTGLPGEANTENKTIFIFGHSTNGTWNIARYNALFYALKDMQTNDEFSVWFWGKEFHYKVSETKIVAANDVSFLMPQTSKDQLILQTCWPPGTSWKRFLVIAQPVK